MLMNKEQVLKFLPHRPPFLFIDSVESVEVPHHGPTDVVEKKDLIGCTVVAHFKVQPDLVVLEGHFPGNPIMPGVIQVEMMAQASCFAITRLLKDPFAVTLEVALLKIESAKFRKPIRPGMNLTIKAVCTKLRNQMMWYDCSIEHDGEILSESSLMAMAEF
jgi:3-hydroxyacyl-[acyl-carrier-protein] dehydratase